MFTRFFAALRRLTEAAEALADSLTDANARFRTNVLDVEETPALPEPEERGRKRLAAK